MPLEIREDDSGFIVLFHNNPNPMWIIETETLKFKDVNEAAVSLYGYTRSDFFNKLRLSDIYPVSDDSDRPGITKEIKHGKTIKSSLTHIKKDGSTIHVQLTSYNIIFNDSQCRMSIINDITDQKLKDTKLSEALNKINETLESITDGFIMLDKRMRISYWNKEAERMLGISREMALHKRLWQLYPYYRELNVIKQFTHAIKHKETVKFEEYVASAGKWICFTVYPGNEGLTVYFQDITGQKQGEELINLKNQSLDQIAYINSHMIRKPLANILGIINSLEETPHADEQLEQPLNLLKQSAIELDNIIMDINTRVEKTIK